MTAGASLFAELAARTPAVRAGSNPGYPPLGSGPIQTAPFLDLCSALLPVLAALGKGLAPARADIASNLERLKTARAGAAAPPGSPDADVRAIAAAELESVNGNADALHGSTSAAKALLWLVRTLAFVGAVVGGVAASDGVEDAPSLPHIARDAYGSTLRPFHGPVTGKAVSAALFFAPSRAAFWKAVTSGGGGGGANVAVAAAEEARTFMVGFNSILADLQAYLKESGLDDPTPVR